MKLPRRQFLYLAAGCATLPAISRIARAQAYPSRPVKIIAPTGPGNAPDVIARVVSDQLSRLWGQQVVVENRPGASGAIAVRAAAAAVPDGYTLYFAISSNFVSLPILQPSLQHDVGRDFVPIGFVGEQPMVIAISPSLRVNSLSELVALSKKRQGEINCAVLQRLTLPHLAVELLRSASGADLTVVNYPATSAGLNDLLGGRVQVIIDGMAPLAGMMKAGSVTTLATMSTQRLPNFPDLPTVSETLPGVRAIGWLALMGPPGTPDMIVRNVSEKLGVALGQPDLKQRFEDLATFVRPMSPTELSDFIRGEQELWKPVLARANAK